MILMEFLFYYLGWKTLNKTYCAGTFGTTRKELAANSSEQCREFATADSQCSNILYFCSPSLEFNHGFLCRCIMKGKTCERITSDSDECTVERKGTF